MRSFASKLITAFVLSFFVISTPLPALAATDYGLTATANAAGLKTNKSLPELVGQIVGAGLSLLGIIFLGLMLYGGFRWMTARGETKLVTEAKDTITNAIIGIVIVVSAYAITDFVIKAVVGGARGGGGGGVSAAEGGGGYDECLNSCEQATPNNEDLNNCYDQCGDTFLKENLSAGDQVERRANDIVNERCNQENFACIDACPDPEDNVGQNPADCLENCEIQKIECLGLGN